MIIRQVTVYSRNNRCPVTSDYDPKTVSPYGSKWIVRIYENGRITARLVETNVYVDEKKIKDSFDRFLAAGGR